MTARLLQVAWLLAAWTLIGVAAAPAMGRALRDRAPRGGGR